MLYLVGSVVLGCASIAAQMDHQPALRGREWLSFLFAFPVATFAWLAIRPRRLTLDDEGFVLSGGFSWRPTRVFWREVEAFYVCQPGRGSRAVGFRYRSAAKDYSHLADDLPTRRPTVVLQGWDEPPEAMVLELNRYRARAVGEMA
ncbi:MAG: alpha/beta hydrolase [Caulobacterales bacterium]|nr:alpha/beta hydrolase [Caulobacterales bacterium]